MSDRREDFLLNMYSELWENINRHILVVWQSVGLLFAAFAAMFLSEAEYLQPDVATALVVLVCFWVIAHAYDASGWFNRNLVIITNIEKQFLTTEDAKHVHYFFTRPHRSGSLIEHFKIQISLAVAVAAIALIRHLMDRIVGQPAAVLRNELVRWLPYASLMAGLVLVGILVKHLHDAYKQLAQESPGAENSS